MTRYRSLPDLPKPVVDDLEVTYELGRQVYPDMPGFTDWLQGVLLAASEAIRAGYEVERSRGAK